jgi:hypothetical protein
MSPASLLLTCVLAAPADAPAPAPVPAPLPVAVAPVGVAGCGGCGLPGGNCAVGICPGTQDPNPMEKTGLWSRLKKRFKRGDKADGGDCAAAAPAGGGKRPSNLLDWLRGRGGDAAGGTVAVAPTCAGCAAAALPVAPPPVPVPGTPAVAPAPTPAPAPAGEGQAAPAKVNTSLPAVPVPMPGGKPAF